MFYKIPSTGFVFISNKYSKIYYYNPISHKTQWNPFNINYTIKLPKDWVIYQVEKTVYFYNEKTKETQYKIPETAFDIEGVNDPMANYYINNGIPLEDYKNTIIGLKNTGIVIPTKDITKITDGCKNISDISKLVDYLLENSPNLTEIDVSNCDVTLEIEKKLMKFSKLQVIISKQRLEKISPSFSLYLHRRDRTLSINKFNEINSHPTNACSLVKNWKQFFSEYLEFLNDNRYSNNSEWAKWIYFGWKPEEIVKGLLATRHNAQIGYREFINTIIYGTRYSPDLFINPIILHERNPDDLTHIEIFLKLFFQYGAEPNLERLLTPERIISKEEIKTPYQPSDEENIDEEESVFIEIKAKLIDSLYKLNPDYVSNEKLNKYLPSNWNNIQPEYLDYTIGDEINIEEYKQDRPFIQQYWENMKYFSKRLRDYKLN